MKTILAHLLRGAADRLDPPAEGVEVPAGWSGYLVYRTDSAQTQCPYCGQWFLGSHGCTLPGQVAYLGPLSSAVN